jgi:hypothetical protein
MGLKPNFWMTSPFPLAEAERQWRIFLAIEVAISAIEICLLQSYRSHWGKEDKIA